MNRLRHAVLVFCLACLPVRGWTEDLEPRPLVLTQVPAAGATNHALQSAIELRYPLGSRVVLSEIPHRPDKVRVLSEGLSAAGHPIVSYDGKSVYFVGKAAPTTACQIYRAQLNGGRCVALTSMPGGATDCALLPDGGLVFASPIPAANPEADGVVPPQLYAQNFGEKPRQLTFGPGGAWDPTVLLDGRILFISTPGRAEPNSISPGALYTINNDGTEVMAFAGQHDRAASIERPLELGDGRIAFLVAAEGSILPGGTAEFVRSARPLAIRTPLLPNLAVPARSVQPAGDGHLLVCVGSSASASASSATWSVFALSTSGDALRTPLFTDPAWDTVEAVAATPSRRPMGRISNMDLTKKTGQILCLNANDSTYGLAGGRSVPAASRMRVLLASTGGGVRVLGEVEVQPDGSFMAEVPADVSLGFEALDGQGRVLRRVDPLIWVRPGENRSCIGCHAPHNRAPHNHRPLAVRVKVPRLCDDADLTRASKGPKP
jgi:hypothetical protein